MFELHKLLWDIRNVPSVNARFKQDPGEVVDAYGIEEPDRTSLMNLDFRALYERGANPYLLYFCAIQLEVDRAQYYAQLRNEEVAGT
ncbi:hypothetical protein [Enemella sp. A6]|uniref:hypothetical protein n=1 Tax=Enemella sp. A6 TaxID=3440152 RepID=UPI003EB8DA26